MFRNRIWVVTLAVAIALALPAKATTSYGSFTAMQTANSGLVFTNVSFDSLLGNSYSPTLTMGSGVGFTAASGLSTLTVNSNPGGAWPAGAVLQGATKGGEIDIALPSGTLAFGASFGEVGSTILTITLSGSGDSSFSYQVSPSSGTPVYIGVSSTSAFSNVKIATDFPTFEQLALNNFSFGTESVTEAPEPTTMAMIGSGLLILPLIRRRRVRQQAKPGAEPCP